jgi:zinc protease
MKRMETKMYKGFRESVILIILALICLFYVRTAQAIEAKREVLDNGLVLFHSEKDHLPMVAVSLLIKVSPLHEPSEKAGLANLVAELLTEGTEKRTAEELAEEIEFIGAALGVSQGRDYATITLTVLKRHLEKGFDLLSDILLNPTFREEEIERKKALIKDSLKQAEEEPSFVASREFRKAVYGEHPYGRLVEGTVETISSITREDIINFYKTYYRPNNAIMAVVGDISAEELHGLIRRYLSSWQNVAIPEYPEYKVALLKEPKIITIDRDLTQANIKFGHLGIRRDNPDYYAVSVMNYILGGGGFASRLMSRIRDDMGLAYDVHSFFTSSKGLGIFQVGVQTKNPSARTVIDVIKEEIIRIQTEPVSEQELEDAKAYLTGSFPRRIDTMGKIASFLVLTEFYGLGMDYDKKYPLYINRVSREDVLRVAKKYLHPDRYVLVVVGDMKQVGKILP